MKFSNFDSRVVSLAALAAVVLAGAFAADAQVRPIYDQGAVGLGQMLKRIGNTKRIMHIGAHPDDEDSDLLAYLARKENARVVYLSLTRGDGGQNVIGPELFEALGVIRTEELLQARTLDGAEQMFTRAFDYGYSKTLEEARRFWDEEKIKCDIVRAIRSFRPQVVNPRFSGTPADGHGQHQFAGYIAPIAVKAAADPNECPGTGAPWKVQKFYVGQSFRSNAEPSLSLNTGLYDQLIGRSYYEIAAYGRSQHKSQEQGGLELRGERYSGVNLVESSVETPAKETSMFDGVDTSWKSLAEGDNDWVKGYAKTLSDIEWHYARGIPAIALSDMGGSIDTLLKARTDLNEHLNLFLSHATWPTSNSVIWKRKELDNAIRLASGIQIDALTEHETVTPGETFGVGVNVFYPEGSSLTMKSVELKAPDGWKIETIDAAGGGGGPARFRENPREARSFKVTVPVDQEYTQPYFLEKPREGFMYQWPEDGNRNLPFQPALITAQVTMDVKGTEITFEQPVEYRFAHPTRGELRRELNVVPALSLDLDQHLLVVPKSAKEDVRKVALNITSNSSTDEKGTLKLSVPKGWRAKLASETFEIPTKGDSISIECEIGIPANTRPGSYRIAAEAETGSGIFSKTMNTIAYEHIQTHRFYTDAAATVAVMDLKVAPVKIGYIPGSGDSGPEALRQMGLSLEMLDGKTLTSGDLSRFDTIVVGIRASETNPAFVASNGRLLDYVRAGGTLIVQYQQYQYQQRNLAPYPAQYNARVSEEDAAVTILEPGHPVFSVPNKITQDDFLGWVQERNLYAFRTFDERYTPLLEAHDTGEPENKGGMVYTELGKGRYMYVSYSFFRQFPAGVPGAYRLFANIVSLGKEQG
ncbi:MAG TPA: PIG-L family deacetylase [Aridibacter sp.]|nr:PIG-L family deacetylase [Aridibacter sp.]